jgi:hypothetical protein
VIQKQFLSFKLNSSLRISIPAVFPLSFSANPPVPLPNFVTVYSPLLSLFVATEPVASLPQSEIAYGDIVVREQITIGP